MSFFKELQRRKVYTVAAAYIVVAWLLIQVAATIFPIYDTPGWVLKAFTSLLFLGFPVALVLAWAYDLTARGPVRTRTSSGPSPDPEGGAADSGRESPAGDTVALPDGPSIAVLPFRNLGEESSEDLFAQALTGDIISGLTRSSHLFVLTAGATQDTAGGDPDIAGIGKRLGVRYLLLGSVRRAGGTLRVSARLVETSSGVQIWSQAYDRESSAENLFSVQDDIREQIVATLSDLHGVIYSTQSRRNLHRPTSSLNAYECLSVALAYDRQINEENHRLARESLERATEIDPQFDEAWAHLSWIYTDEYVYGFNLQPEPMERALQAARKGVELAEDNYHNHWLLSRVHYFMGNRDRFLASAERALELNASDGTTLGLIGMYLAWSGEWNRGMEMMDKARLLNPNFPDYYHFVYGTADFAGGDYEAALKDLLKANLPAFPPLLIFLSASFAALGRDEEAGRQVQTLREFEPGLTVANARDYLARIFPFQPGLIDSVVGLLDEAGLPHSLPEPADATPRSDNRPPGD